MPENLGIAVGLGPIRRRKFDREPGADALRPEDIPEPAPEPAPEENFADVDRIYNDIKRAVLAGEMDKESAIRSLINALSDLVGTKQLGGRERKPAKLVGRRYLGEIGQPASEALLGLVPERGGA